MMGHLCFGNLRLSKRLARLVLRGMNFCDYADLRPYLNFLARVESIEILASGKAGPESATTLVGDMKVLIPLAGLIDKDAELARLEKEMGKLTQEVERTEKKLSNPNFVDKAPEAVVQKEKDKMAVAHKALENLQEQAEKIRSL